MKSDSVHVPKGRGGHCKGPTATPSVETEQLGRNKDADILRQAPAGTAEVPVIQSEQNVCLQFGFEIFRSEHRRADVTGLSMETHRL